MRNIDKTPGHKDKDKFTATEAALNAQQLLHSGDKTGANEELTVVDRLTRNDLLRLARSELGPDYYSDAEDIVQDVYMKTHRVVARGGFRGDSKIETYLIRSVINRSRDHIDKHKKQMLIGDENFFEDRLGQDKDPYEEIDERLSQGEATKLLAKLKEHRKLVIFLLVSGGLSYKAISRLTKSPEGTLKSWATRGKREIRDKMSND